MNIPIRVDSQGDYICGVTEDLSAYMPPKKKKFETTKKFDVIIASGLLCFFDDFKPILNKIIKNDFYFINLVYFYI